MRCDEPTGIHLLTLPNRYNPNFRSSNREFFLRIPAAKLLY